MKRLFDTLITDLADRQVLGVVEGRGKENLEEENSTLKQLYCCQLIGYRGSSRLLT